MRLDCLNSGGLNGYDFSHWGLFASGHIFKGFKKETTECADECNKDDQCIAFNHRSGDDKTCIVYHFIDKRLYEGSTTGEYESTTYIKCSSMYLLFM